MTTVARILPTSRLLALTVVTFAALMAAGCGKKEGGATQVAAKVNKAEISVHQVNFMLQRQNGLKPDQVPAASKRVLEGLIDQELAAQAAEEQKLDRDPRVVLALEIARREIIGRAYLEKLGEAAAKPNEDEITRYYATKPGLFAQRRIYTLREVTVDATGDLAKSLMAKGNSLKSDDFVEQLKAANVRYGARQLTQAPENLPLDLVDKLATAAEGKSIVTNTPNGFMIVYVMSAKPAPLTEDQSRQAIEAFLHNDRKRGLIAQGVKALRDNAKIAYQGQFSGGPSAAAPEAAPLPTGDAASDTLDDKALQKGLKGLK